MIKLVYGLFILSLMANSACAAPAYPIEELLLRAKFVCVGTVATVDQANVTLKVRSALRGSLKDELLTMKVDASFGKPEKGHWYFVFSQGHDRWGVPKNEIKLSPGMHGQGSYCGWIMLPIQIVDGKQTVQHAYTQEFQSVTLDAAKRLVRETKYKGAHNAATLTEALEIADINSATVVHSTHGFANYRGRATAFVNDQKILAAMNKVLGKYPAKGGLFKSWPKDISRWRIYLHGDDHKVVSLDIFGRSLQSPLDATFSVPRDDPQNRELMTLLEGIERNVQFHRFRDRRGPVGKPRESDWRLARRDRDKIIAEVKEYDNEQDSLGDPDDWQWDDAELYVDGNDNYLLWVYYQSRNRGKVWRWLELDSERKQIYASGWGEG